MNGPGLVVYGIAFYELDPPYICTYMVDGVESEAECDYKEVCEYEE